MSLAVLRFVLPALMLALVALPYRFAAAETAQQPIGPPPGDLQAAPGEHPLTPLIRWGRASLPALEAIDDYTGVLVRREFIGNRLQQPEYLTIKVRHRPFSVYTATLGRDRTITQESIFVEGRNDGMMWVHTNRYRYLGTIALYPDARQVMRENRYPVTQAGLENLVERLVEAAEAETQFECQVEILPDTAINKRPCVCLVVTHPEKQEGMQFHKVRLFIDRQLNVPVRYESFWWPREPGGQPQLLEEYTYLDLQFNRGLNDADFDIANPAYKFPPPEQDPPQETAPPPLATAAPRPTTVASATRWQTFKPLNDGHPLRPVVQLLDDALARLDNVTDYTCILTRRERFNGLLPAYEHAMLKVRNAPAAVAVISLGPMQARGRESFYRPAIDPDLVWLRPTRRAAVVRVRQTDPVAMHGQRRPISRWGLGTLMTELRQLCLAETPFAECHVRYVEGAKIDGRPAICVEIVHPRQRTSFRFHCLRLYFDDEHRLLTRYEGYSWPAPGQPPRLEEEYTYRQLELNVGLRDADFTPRDGAATLTAAGGR